MTEQKTITVPDSWADVSIGQFQEISAIDSESKNRALEIVSILIDQDIEDIRKYDLKSLNAILKAISWANDLPKEETWKNVIEIDGEEYGFINKLSDLTLGEWIDLEGYIEKPIENLHKIAGLFYRPIVHKYRNSILTEPYDTVSSEARADLFKEKMNVADMYGAMVFFCLIEKNCIKTIQDYFLIQTIMVKLSKKTNQRKKLGWLTKLKLKSGLGTLTLMSWLKATSRKWRASLN